MESSKSIHKITICETLRQIRDICQSGSDNDKKVRILLTKATNMAKKMNARLVFYAEYYHTEEPWDKDMWKKNRKKKRIRST